MIGARGIFGENKKEEYEQQLQENRNKALKLIEKADWETLLQMAGFVFSEPFIRGHLIASMQLADEKKINDFDVFFSEPKSELNKKYNEIFRKDILDAKL